MGLPRGSHRGGRRCGVIDRLAGGEDRRVGAAEAARGFRVGVACRPVGQVPDSPSRHVRAPRRGQLARQPARPAGDSGRGRNRRRAAARRRAWWQHQRRARDRPGQASLAPARPVPGGHRRHAGDQARLRPGLRLLPRRICCRRPNRNDHVKGHPRCQGLCATPPNTAVSAGSSAELGSGRHCETGTTPGASTFSSPKNAAICSGLRR